MKIDGYARSGLPSMRSYVNVSLLLAAAVLGTFLTLAGAALGAAGGAIRRRVRVRGSRADGTS